MRLRSCVLFINLAWEAAASRKFEAAADEQEIKWPGRAPLLFPEEKKSEVDPTHNKTLSNENSLDSKRRISGFWSESNRLETKQLTYNGFKLLAEDVFLDIVSDEAALMRIFDSVAKKRRGGYVVSFSGLKKGMQRSNDRELLKTLVHAWNLEHLACPRLCELRGPKKGIKARKAARSYCMSKCFEVDSDYNFSRDTATNYASTTPSFQEQFKAVRETRDADYHGYYTRDRQFWQDTFISRVIYRAPSGFERPWLLYTAGGMGVGKGYVMSWLSKLQKFAPERMVTINPDYFKMLMPEFHGYTSLGKDQGTKCHKESGFMQEIALWESLHRGSNIMEDGSMRDTGWYGGTKKADGTTDWQGIVPMIREKFPHYRVGVIHVVLDAASDDDVEAVLKKRLAKRAEKEGRETPLDKAMKAYKDAQQTVDMMRSSGLADFVVEIDNTLGRDPRMLRVADERGAEWKTTEPDAWHYIEDRFSPENLQQMSDKRASAHLNCDYDGCKNLTNDDLVDELTRAFPYMTEHQSRAQSTKSNHWQQRYVRGLNFYDSSKVRTSYRRVTKNRKSLSPGRVKGPWKNLFHSRASVRRKGRIRRKG